MRPVRLRTFGTAEPAGAERHRREARESEWAGASRVKRLHNGFANYV